MTVLDVFVQGLRAHMPAHMRTELAKYDRLIATSRSDAEREQRRAYMAVDYVVRAVMPRAMVLRGHDHEHWSVREIPPIVDAVSSRHAAAVAAEWAKRDDALYCAYPASIAATLAIDPQRSVFAADAAAYAFYLGASAIASPELWLDSLDCVEAMVSV